MASIHERDGHWEVRWKEPETIIDEHGNTIRRWKSRRRKTPTLRAAHELLNSIEKSSALGERWEDPRKKPIITIRAVALDYLSVIDNSGAPEKTVEFHSSMLGGFLDYLGAKSEDGPGAERLVTELSLPLLRSYAGRLPSRGRQATTRLRKVREVELMWAWAWRSREQFPGIPEPRTITEGGATAELRAAPPVRASAAPTWADVDAMIPRLSQRWHRQAALLRRCFGLRASQACGLHWEDLDLEERVLHVHANVTGSKSSRSRVVPMAPWLVTEISRWAPPEERKGLLFPRRYRQDGSKKRFEGAYRGDSLVAPFRRAWIAAGVPEVRWGLDQHRAKGSPSHALRRMLRNELIRGGFEEAIVLYYIGQTQGVTAAAYVPESCPEQSPYWPRLVAMVESIPQPSFLPLA